MNLKQKEENLKKIEGVRAELTAGERKLRAELEAGIEVIDKNCQEKVIEVRRKNDSGKEFALNKHRAKRRESLEARAIADREREIQKIKEENQA